MSKLKEVLRKLINIKGGNEQQSRTGEGTESRMGAADSVKAKRKQDLISILVLGLISVVGFIFMKYQSGKGNAITVEEAKIPRQLEVASQALDTEKMWRNYFEDKLTDTTKQSAEKLKTIEDSINEQSATHQNQLKNELDKLRAQIQYLVQEQEASKNRINDNSTKIQASEEAGLIKKDAGSLEQSRFTVNNLNRDELFDYPKSSRNFIPETAYVKGVLLGGIAVSTALGSSAEPVPVIIRITGRGNLHENFNMDVTQCQIMGSSYGDISSERAIIRAEVLSCHDRQSELIYTTKVAGVIFGDDGMNGIKGKVIQTSGKHLKNAIIGGMISGFANSAKGRDQFSISSVGAIDSKKKGLDAMAREGGWSGASNAAEKIADYYIKQAEAMSPVLLVAGGTKVDIVFTKGVYFGALDVQEKLQKHREVGKK